MQSIIKIEKNARNINTTKLVMPLFIFAQFRLFQNWVSKLDKMVLECTMSFILPFSKLSYSGKYFYKKVIDIF